ncbi:MAG TPA: ATP synthase F1 subunit gamma [Candidatus Fusicatenibacter intestinipullorum]|nr:ATP synthase F1 subunit gamma [Phascolarctobacterium faecium]MDM8109506.1 ATP synthase F1 subunit gamma [Phascolarctobacterium faecium]HJA44725.1 ATP synthase F1 subunit gamma [Candidatus Phascolarctobacterium stercoravium]HJA51472.1 ATP synthase F1 subunit gamma [Candidatus Fusicatenibacter intestinipullorum]
MATAREIHRHMKSVKNIGQITKAMKMVAAARLRRAQERAAASRPYAIKIKEVLSNIVGDKGTLSGLSPRKHPLIQKRPVKKIGFLVMCSDKGLAGAYGSNVLKHAMGEILKVKGEVVIITCGRRARDFFRHRGFNVIQAHFGFSDKPSYNNAVEIAYDAAQRFADEQFDELRIVYTLFKSALSQTPTNETILPLEPPAEEAPKGGEAQVKANTQYLFLPEAEEILADLAPRYLETVIYAALVQSAASELGSRMTAMSSATDNAAKLVKSLELNYNKARQALITRELTEICGGAEALKQN